ncbi:Serine/threonine-protein kinase DCLK3 [Holothuria leucospilota]|uniref:non-specific serine/threonine protein kinase n=1 Tax=Holothuria leucospilota TaxID=206669 RepID=A0A9Q1H716_HOLLE|nr:Serine/threonine-protein kinase DCLK3 [Holothuria leucospilota]
MLLCLVKSNEEAAMYGMLPESKPSQRWLSPVEDTLVAYPHNSKPLARRRRKRAPNPVVDEVRTPIEAKSTSSNSFTDQNVSSDILSDSRLPKHVHFYRNGDKFYKGKKFRITPQRYVSLDGLLSDLTKSVSLPYGVRKLYTPNGGTRIRHIDDIRDGESYVCASFEKFKKLKYGAVKEQDWKSTRKADIGDNFLYGSSLASSYPAGGKYAAAYGKTKGKTEPSPFKKESDNIPVDSRSLPPKYLSSLNNKPKLIKIVKAGKKPYQSVSLLLNRKNILSYEQLMQDISEAFGLPNHRHYKISKLYNAKGDEIKGVADFFRDQDGVVIGATLKTPVLGEDLVSILEEVLPDSSLGRKLRAKQMKESVLKVDSGIENDDDASSLDNPSSLPSTLVGGSREEETKNADKIGRNFGVGDGKGRAKGKGRVDGNGGETKNGGKREIDGENASKDTYEVHVSYTTKKSKVGNDGDGLSGLKDQNVSNKNEEKRQLKEKRSPVKGNQNLPLERQIKAKESKERTRRGIKIKDEKETVAVGEPANVRKRERKEVKENKIDSKPFEEKLDIKDPLPDITEKKDKGSEETQKKKKRKKREAEKEKAEAEIKQEEAVKMEIDEDKDYFKQEEERLAKLLSVTAQEEAEREILETYDFKESEAAFSQGGLLDGKEDDKDDKINEERLDLTSQEVGFFINADFEEHESQRGELTSKQDEESSVQVKEKEEELHENERINVSFENLDISGNDNDRKVLEDSKSGSSVLEKSSSPKKDFEFSGKTGRFVVKPRPICTERDVLDRYKLGEKIGDGNFADVHVGILRQTGEEFAIKKVDKSKLKGKESMIENEIAILNEIDHPNVVKLYEEYETEKYIYLVMDYVRGGDLFDAIIDSVKFTEADASVMVRDLASALNYLHEMNVVHRDMKPENLLVNLADGNSMQLKLADFGLAMEVIEPVYTVCGTPTYVAPEILAETGYGLPVDMWALGVITYILLCGFPPFRSPDRNQDELFELIQSGKYEYISPYWNNISSDAKDLIDHLLVVDKKKRYTAKQVLDHPWIKGGERNNSVTNLQREVSMNLEKNFSRPSSSKR